MKRPTLVLGASVLAGLLAFEHTSHSQTESLDIITTVSWPDGVHPHVQDLLTTLTNHCEEIADRLVLNIAAGIFEDEIIKWPIVVSLDPLNIPCPKPITVRGAGIGKTVFLDRNLGAPIPLAHIELGEGTVVVSFPVIQDVEISHLTIQVVGDPDFLKHRNFSVAIGLVRGAKVHDLEMLGRRRGIVCLICEDTEIYNNRIVGTGTDPALLPTLPSQCIDIQQRGSNHDIHHNDLSNCVRGVNVFGFIGIQEDADVYRNVIHNVANGIVCGISDRCVVRQNIIDGTVTTGILYAGSNDGDIHHNLLCNIGGIASPIRLGVAQSSACHHRKPGPPQQGR